jgi:peptidoglycan/xylan/chitin deacetylase (PgdA/CDA1 family)
VSAGRAAAPARAPLRSRALTARERRALDRYVRLARPLYCGGARGRYVALTFDDGPGPYTALALRILRHAHATATFFLVGRNLATWPNAAPAEARLGVIGDHTWTHAWLPALSPQQVVTQLARTRAALARSTDRPVQLFRPPYGAHTGAIDRDATRLGMLEVLWSIDTRDSEGASWAQIAEGVARELRPGAIVLMHENHGQTIEALVRRILPLLHRLRYQTVTIPELLALDPPNAAEQHGDCSVGVSLR